MKVIVDTSVWSLALRRREVHPGPEVNSLSRLIEQGLVVLMGSIRQELLSGIKSESQFKRLRNRLSAFPNLKLVTKDYEFAADLCNRCMAKGVQASHTDFLIAAAAINRDFAVFSTDRDFSNIAKIIPVKIYNPQ